MSEKDGRPDRQRRCSHAIECICGVLLDGVETLASLAPSLALTTQLTSLHLMGNDIGDAGAPPPPAPAA